MCSVVITGMGIVTPLGMGRERAWRRLRGGGSGLQRFVDPQVPNLRVRMAGLVSEGSEDAGEDGASFPGSPGDDRFIRLALAAADEAFGDAQIADSGVRPERVGCVVGSSKGGVASLLRMHEALRSGSSLAEGALFQVLPDMAGVRIAARHGLKGPIGNDAAACATGAACIIRGAELIRRGWCDAVVAGSSDASITPLILAGFDRMGVLSRANDDPPSACKPYDIRRDGFVIGEGAAALIIEKRKDAEARGAGIYAELAGWAMGAQGYHEVNPDPSGRAIAEVMRLATERADLTVSDIGYLNAHGTATALGDLAETRAIKAAFGKEAESLAISSTKPQTGHLLGAAGSVEFALSVLALRDGFIPPTRNLKEPAPECDLDYVPLKGRCAELRAAMSVSAGFGGQVAALLATR